MLDYPAALARLAALDVPARTESLPLDRALGRVLAEPVVMDRDQPSFDRATMDGYALALPRDGGPALTEFRVVGTVAAGASFPRALAAGEAVRIMTGAPVPSVEGPGLAAVVPIEHTSAGAGHVAGSGATDAGTPPRSGMPRPGESAGGPATVSVLEPASLAPGRNVARRGEDARSGDVVLAAGLALGPVHLAAAAMAGVRELRVAVPPRVAIVTTGDEVGQEGTAGVRDTNGPLLLALTAALGVPAVREHAPDESGALEAALARAAASADVVVTTGGVSMGDRDLVPAVAARLGFELVFHRVAIQPGKPVLVARRPDGALFLGLPGNPVSVLATAHLFLLPALDRCLGVRATRWLDVTMGEPHRHDGQRHLFLPAQLVDGTARALAWNGSGDLFAAAHGDGLLDLPVGARFERGARARLLPYVGHRIGARGELPPRGAR